MSDTKKIPLDETTRSGLSLEKGQGVADTVLSESGSLVPTCKPPVITPRMGGEITMAKSTCKVGVVSILELGNRRWQLRYRDPSTRLEVKRRLSGMNLREVQAVAAHLSQEALAGRGYLAARKRSCPTVEAVFEESIRLSRQRPYVRKDSWNRAKLFLGWLSRRHPEAKRWDDLRPSMIQHYVQDMEARGLAHYTIRNHLRPVRMAWKFASENYHDLVRPLPTIRQGTRPPREIKCLSPSELRTLLDWLCGRHPDLYCMTCLQALAGLRVLEATHLRRRDIDFSQSTISVTSTGEHDPKNAGSCRVIPVCSTVLDALMEYMTGQRIIPASGELFLTRIGSRWTPSSWNHRWRKVLCVAAKETGIPRIAEVAPQELRRTFATLVCQLGVEYRMVQRYMGQVARDILGLHYRRITVADLRSVSAAMERWNTLVEGTEKWKHLGNLDG